jgi:hypothetical protein
MSDHAKDAEEPSAFDRRGWLRLDALLVGASVLSAMHRMECGSEQDVVLDLGSRSIKIVPDLDCGRVVVIDVSPPVGGMPRPIK